ncbi:MAG: glycosyltransferase family A protein [Cyanobacteria bacterium J06648_11]
MVFSLITSSRNRSKLLKMRSLPSVLAQTSRQFEWVFINDGGDPATRDAIASIETDFPIVYSEMEHPSDGFGLCHGRNFGLSLAQGEWVAYLDDDNAIAPEFVETAIAFMEEHPEVACAMTRQSRRRDITRDGKAVKRGNSFISPSFPANVEALIRHRELFDSNGFIHRLIGSPRWNPSYRVYADYEYFLQCLCVWGRDRFAVLPEVLVDYVQSSDGVIGQSGHGEWAAELKQLLDESARFEGVLGSEDKVQLARLQQKFEERADRPLAAFVA